MEFDVAISGTTSDWINVFKEYVTSLGLTIIIKCLMKKKVFT